MRMHINKARRNDQAFGVNLRGRVSFDPADSGDSAVLYRQVRKERWIASAIDDAAVTDDNVVSLSDGGEWKEQQACDNLQGERGNSFQSA